MSHKHARKVRIDRTGARRSSYAALHHLVFLKKQHWRRIDATARARPSNQHQVIWPKPMGFGRAPIDADWDLRPDGWHIVVEGDAPFEMSPRFTTPDERKAAVTPGTGLRPGRGAGARIRGTPLTESAASVSS